MRILLPTAVLLSAALPAQTVGLEGLAALARERAARQRPALEAALEPFRADLALEYTRENSEYLESRFAAIKDVGPQLVPLLLEMLAPKDSSEAERNRADNAARVLRYLDPGSFQEALLELARGREPTARLAAIDLLGHGRAERAVPLLVSMLDDKSEDTVVAALASLRRIGSPLAIAPIAAKLGDERRRVRAVALQCLVEIDTEGAAKDAVVAAFAKESSDALLEDYIGYFATHVREDVGVTEKLLPLVTGVRLPLDDRIALAAALGKIAPPKHEPTIETLERIVEEGLTGELEKAAALSLLALDEKGGVREITDRLEEAIRRRRDDSDAYAARADWYTQLGRWREAIRDYDAAIDHARTGSRQAALWLLIARCEAHRGKLTRMCAAIKNARVARETVEREAEQDPVFAEALQNEQVQRFLKKLE